MAEPKEVRRLADDLRELGFDPLVTGTPGGPWLIAIEGEHVRATADYQFRNGRTKRSGGTMVIDGEPAPLAKDYADLRRIWDEHEGTPAAEPESAALMEISDPGGQPVPYVVQSTVKDMKSGIERAGADVGIRTGVSAGHWVIGIDLPGGDGLRIVFTRYGHVWEPDNDQRVQVVAGGQDKTAEAEGDIGKALLLLVPTAPPRPVDPPPGSSAVRQQVRTRDQGVETRRQVVIRELGLLWKGPVFQVPQREQQVQPHLDLVIGDKAGLKGYPVEFVHTY
jgi:hypothetical protein